MDKSEHLSKKEKFELKLYRMLGVEIFKKLVFILEKVIHSRDKGKNINYHLKKNNFNQAEDFKKFLYYNGSIHVKNGILLALLLMSKIIFFKTSIIFDIALILDLLKNGYCVMLQRYNYIRINEYIRKQQLRQDKIIEKEAIKIEEDIRKKGMELSLAGEEISHDLEIISKMKAYLSNISNISVEEYDIATLCRIRNFLHFYNDSKNVEGNISKYEMTNNSMIKEKEAKIL